VKLCLGRSILDEHAKEFERLLPQAEYVVLEPDGRWTGDPDEAEIALLSISLTRDPATAAELPRMLRGRSLRWLQSGGAGVDAPAFSALLDRGVRLTNASGIHAEPIAQYIFTYVLHWERNVQTHQAQQREREWKIIVSGDLSAKTIGIVGLGGIGLATARVARAFGMRVVGLRRSPPPEPRVDRLFGPDGLHDLLGQSDYVVLALPLDESTRHTIGSTQLDAMRRSAVLINVARGGVVDEAALIAALRAGRIRGATLDVTETEPLAADSPLWGLANCVLTPHDAGYSPLGDGRLVALFLDNLRRYAGSEPLRNEVRAGGPA